MAEVLRLIHEDVHFEQIALCIDHRQEHIYRLELIGIKLVHALDADREKESIMEKTIVETKIGIQTRSSRLVGNGVKERRIAQIPMERHEMARLRRQRRMGVHAHAQQRNIYYTYIPSHRLYVL